MNFKLTNKTIEKNSFKYHLLVTSDKIDTFITLIEDRLPIPNLKTLTKILRLRLILKTLSISCLIAAFLDFYFNLGNLLRCYREIIENDNKMNLLKN